MNINDKVFDHRPIDQLLAIVKNDFRRFNAEGMIDLGNLIKVVQYCNEKIGIPIKELREMAIPVSEYKAKLPLDFEKLYHVVALQCANTIMTHNRNPFDNTFDEEVIYEAHLDRASLGNVENYKVVIKKEETQIYYDYGKWTHLGIAKSSQNFCHTNSPNLRHRGKYDVEIKDESIVCPFRTGMLYVLYIGMMKDVDGNITFPFHPMITPYYEWSLKEKILSDMIFNSDLPNLVNLYKLAQQEKTKAWLDAFNFTTEKGFGEMVEYQKRKEQKWYNEYFRYFEYNPFNLAGKYRNHLNPRDHYFNDGYNQI